MSPCSINKSTCPGLHVQYLLPFSVSVTAEPLIRGGLLYIAGRDGSVLCLRCRDGRQQWKIQLLPTVGSSEEKALPFLHRGFAHTGVLDKGGWYIADCGGTQGAPFSNTRPGTLFRLDPTCGKVIWQVSLTSDPYGGCGGNLLDGGDCVFVPTASAAGAVPDAPAPSGFLLAYTKRYGNQVLKIHLPSLLPQSSAADTGCFATGLAMGRNKEKIFVVLGRGSGVSSGTLVCLEKTCGRLLWYSTAGGDHIFSSPPVCVSPGGSAAGQDSVCVGTDDGHLLSFDQETGELIWNADCGCGMITAPAAACAGKLICYGNPDWRPGQRHDTAAPAVGAAVNSADGTVLYRFENQYPSTGDILCSANVFLLGDLRGNITCYDVDTGSVLCRTESAHSSIGGKPATDGDRIFCGCGYPELLGGTAEPAGLICLSAS